MKLTLDRIALRALIDADPDFELSLQKAVISEVGRRFFEKDSSRVIAAAQPELFAKALEAAQKDADMMTCVRNALNESIVTRTTDWHRRVVLHPETVEKLKEHVALAKSEVIREAASKITSAFNDAIQKAVDAKLATTMAEIEERIEKRVSRLVDEEINRRADDRFKARMADLRGMLA